MWAEDAKDGSDDDDSEEEDSEEEEEDSDDEAGPSNAAAAPSGSGNREDRKAQKKARKEAALAKQKSKTIEVGDLPSSDESDDDDDDDMPANPNHSKSARKQADSGVEEVTEGVKNLKAPQNRREREAMEAQIAKEKYMKLQAEGKTDQAKADLARLKLIREQRAADAARRQVNTIALDVIDNMLIGRVTRPKRKKGWSRKRFERRKLMPGRPRSAMLPWDLRSPARRNDRAGNVGRNCVHWKRRIVELLLCFLGQQSRTSTVYPNTANWLSLYMFGERIGGTSATTVNNLLDGLLCENATRLISQ